MNKKLLIGILVVLVLCLVGGGYYWWTSYKKSVPSDAEKAAADLQTTIESVNQNMTKGIFDTTTANPMENVPNVNPYKNTNPFSDIKTNPFQ